MAKQESILKITGVIDGMGFYKRDGKYFVRKHNPVDGKRIKNDETFVRTRENMKEFGAIAKSGKLLRQAIRPMLVDIPDKTIVSRLHKTLAVVKNCDAVATRGNRTVAGGSAHPIAKSELKNFQFNKNAAVAGMLYKQYGVDTTTGVITIPQLLAMEDVIFPAGATHVALTGGWAKLDFAAEKYAFCSTNTVLLSRASARTDIMLVPSGKPALCAGNDYFMLQVSFYQETNGVQYALKNGAFNALCMVDIA
jgi:hypothetical protein